jgi:serine/threonine protein kinase
MNAVTPSSLPVHNPDWLFKRYAPYVPPDGTAAGLGHGRHGAVFPYVDTQTALPVALKVQPTRLYHEDSEWRCQSAVESPYVAKLYACGKQPAGLSSQMFTVMELGETSLQDHLAAHPPSVDEAKRLFSQILLGLEACHKAGVYHRDVKAANMVILQDTLKIVDFGKSMTLGPGFKQRTFEDTDVRRACRVFCDMLPATESRQFRAWVNGCPHLTVDKVKHHPLMAALFGLDPVDVKPRRPLATWLATGMGAVVNRVTSLDH